MPFLVFNAVIGIMFLLALNCVLKCYSLVYLERKMDRAHAIIWNLTWIFIFSLKGLDGCPTVSMMVRIKLVNATDRSDWCLGELGPQLCSGRCPLCWRDNCHIVSIMQRGSVATSGSIKLSWKLSWVVLQLALFLTGNAFPLPLKKCYKKVRVFDFYLEFNTLFLTVCANNRKIWWIVLMLLLCS